MGTTLTNTHKLIKPDDLEGIDVDQLNKNWDKVDAIVPVISGLNIPEGKTPKIWAGTITTSTGAGGNSRTNDNATSSEGIGGLWPGYQGIPKFEGMTAVVISQGNSGDTIFDVGITVMDANPTRIKYRAKRYDGSMGYSFGTMKLNVFIMGY